jgi:hypothetical protein
MANDPRSSSLKPKTVTVLNLPGTIRRQDGAASANRIQVIGVRSSQWNEFVSSSDRGIVDLSGQTVALNASLAAKLKAVPGDELVLRLHKPSALSQDAVITPRGSDSIALRLKFDAVVSSAAGGELDLQASQAPPLNAFVNLDQLAKAAQLEGRANWLLMSGSSAPAADALHDLASRVANAWQIGDAELQLHAVSIQPSATNVPGIPSTWVELVSHRIFLEAPVSAAALKIQTGPDSPSDSSNAVPILTYLANSLEANGQLAPYSMVTAAGPPYTPPDLADDEIIVNQWLADDLKCKPGDSINLTYYRVDTGASLSELTNRFRIRGVVSLDGIYADRSLMPEFPGLSKAESTHDWDAGFPLVHPIRDKDETYWRKWRGTPKAFITLAAGKKMWSNRFGDLTSIRWSVDAPKAAALTAYIEPRLRKNLRPEDVGLTVQATGSSAENAARGGQDFGGLFLGFSFFLILAALLLTSLLFRLALMQRAEEVGVLLAVGWQPRLVRRLIVREALTVAALGTLVGAVCGAAYGSLIITALNTIWRGAVAGAGLEFHFTPASAAIGALSSIAIVFFTLWSLVRRAVRRPAREILQEGLIDSALTSWAKPARRWMRVGPAVVGAAGLACVMMALATKSADQAGLCFGAGFLLLIASLWELRYRLIAPHRSAAAMDLRSFSLRAPRRQPSRSVATTGLLASAAFLIVSVGANKLDATRDATLRNSGTGGFALWGETALPVIQDLNSPKGRDFYSLDPALLANAGFVAMKVRDGDEASCLNLNRALRPRLLGVNPQRLTERKAFAFASTLANTAPAWTALDRDPGATGPVPAIADANSIEWALGKSVGDTVDYIDESGRPFQVRIVGAVANSILQGSLIIAESEFTRLYPNEAGYRAFLVDCPPAVADRVAAELTRGLADLGPEFTPAAARLAAFNAVENTYLDTFQILGGLGLLLGSAGLGIVVMRNVAERRGELGVFRAIGFGLPSIRGMVVLEHATLLVAGLGIGIACALIAVFPALISPGPQTPWFSLAVTMAAIFACGLGCTWAATRAAVTGQVVEALRGE